MEPTELNRIELKQKGVRWRRERDVLSGNVWSAISESGQFTQGTDLNLTQ